MIIPWRTKAENVIAALSLEAYRAANVKANGTKRKKHVPYTIPEDAQTLANCLKTNDEETAKAIFQRHAFGFVNK